MTEQRLQKIIARSGLCSRREADRMIADGRVTVDGRVAKPGEKADPASAKIKVDDRILKSSEALRYLLLHKPRVTEDAALLGNIKTDIDRSLAAILTLNTIAHTVGAGGAGDRARAVRGDPVGAALGIDLGLDHVGGVGGRDLLADGGVVEIVHVQGHLHLAGFNALLDSFCSTPRNNVDLFDIGISQRGLENAVPSRSAGAEYGYRLHWPTSSREYLRPTPTI